MKQAGVSTDGAKRAAIYRRAAEALESSLEKMANWGCCDVINEAVHGDPCTDSAAMRLFEAHFKPEDADRCYWGAAWGYDGENVVECRLLALCFMAAMVEAGDA